MRRDVQVALLERLLEVVTRGEVEAQHGESRVEVSRYVEPTRLEEERRVLFGELPIIVGRESDVPDVGAYFTHDLSGAPLLVTRAPGGRIVAMLNVCLHRGARLVDEAQGSVRALVCPYHGWTYDLDGALRPVPSPRSFPTLRRQASGLVELPCAVRHGFVWVAPRPSSFQGDLVSWLGDFDEDMTSFGLDRYVVFRRREVGTAASWKVVMETFLESYGMKVLHARTLARSLRQESVSDTSAAHARLVIARRNLPEVANHGRAEWDLLRFASLAYMVFPNVILTFNGRYVSQVAVFPGASGGATFVHTLLVPRAPEDASARDALDAEFRILDEDVYGAENIAMAERVESSLHAGASWAFQLGMPEYLVRFFHERIDATLAKARLRAARDQPAL